MSLFNGNGNNGGGLKVIISSATIVAAIFVAGVMWARMEAFADRISKIEADVQIIRNYLMPPGGPR